MPVKCEECGEREPKYRCPGCGLRSCGLDCVKSHKDRTQCTGKRKRTLFVPLSGYDDNWLISDYNFLEETLRQTDSAKRLRVPMVGAAADISPSLKALQRQAKNRSTTLLFAPNGMSKRKANTTYYERKTKRILWRVEWTFEGTDVRLTDVRVDENVTLESVLAKHLTDDGADKTIKYRLRNFSEESTHELKLLLLKERCSAAEKTFYELNLKEGLRDQLAHKCILEYPVIHVLLARDLQKYVIVADPMPLHKPTDQDVTGPITPTIQEPEGIPLREEEIEEGEFIP